MLVIQENDASETLAARTERIKRCRACGSAELAEILDLGALPLANALHRSREEALAARRYPLKVLFCRNCFMA